MIVLQLIAGMALLIGGAEALIRGASRLARAAGVSPLVIGLTVVALATSSPEMAVSFKAALAGQADIAVGNVVGSNAINILLILGLSALLTPLTVSAQLIRLDVPLMILASAATWWLARNGRIDRVDGAAFVVALLAYIVLCVRLGRREGREVKAQYEREYGGVPAMLRGRWYVQIALVVVGLGMLIFGSQWLVDAAVVIARHLGASELVIALTIVAGGTSLPEVATSVMAGLRGERDIAVGNVVGSNLFNLLAVLGGSALLSPVGVAVSPAVLRFDLPVMVIVAVACLPIFITGRLISRWEGALFLAGYIAYTACLIRGAATHGA